VREVVDRIEALVSLAIAISTAVGLWLWVVRGIEGKHAFTIAVVVLVVSVGLVTENVAPTKVEVSRSPTLAEVEAMKRAAQQNFPRSEEDVAALGLASVLQVYGPRPFVFGGALGVLGLIAVAWWRNTKSQGT
jgi:hypothetical protein